MALDFPFERLVDVARTAASKVSEHVSSPTFHNKSSLYAWPCQVHQNRRSHHLKVVQVPVNLLEPHALTGES